MRRDAKGACDDRHEAALFARDELSSLSKGKVLAPMRVGFQPLSVGLVSGQGVKGNQPPRNVVGAFVGQKVPQQMSAASGNDPPPIFGVLVEGIALEGIVSPEVV